MRDKPFTHAGKAAQNQTDKDRIARRMTPLIDSPPENIYEIAKRHVNDNYELSVKIARLECRLSYVIYQRNLIGILGVGVGVLLMALGTYWGL